MRIIEEREHYLLALLTEEEAEPYKVQGMAPRYAIYNKEFDVLEALDSSYVSAKMNLDYYSKLIDELSDAPVRADVRQLNLITSDDDDPTQH